MGKIIRNGVRDKNCILDGEMMTWDTVTEDYSPFGLPLFLSCSSSSWLVTFGPNTGDHIDGISHG